MQILAHAGTSMFFSLQGRIIEQGVWLVLSPKFFFSSFTQTTINSNYLLKLNVESIEVP